MKVGSIPENLLELCLALAGELPTPLTDTLQALLRARAIMAASRLGVFEALGAGPAAAAEVATGIGADGRATEKLLNGLVGAGYVRFRNDRYKLAPVARKWLLTTAPRSLHDNMLHRFL